jgi:multidrug efflux system membrane fusion protein
VAITILALAAVGGAVWYASSRPGDSATTASHQGAGEPEGRGDSLPRATPVVAAPVRQGNLDIYLFALGTVTPLNTVVVRPRVDGQIMSIAFEEGQLVKAGDLLAQIDPRPFEVQLALATGQLARDQALLDNARADLERYRALLAQDSISGQLVDTQKSLVRQYTAAVQAGQGGIDNAKLQLANARVVAPISGRVGLRQIGPGNIVRASDANGLVVITQLQPVGVVFSIPEDALPRVMKRLRTSDRVPVDAYDRAQKEKLGKGRLLAADNQIDTATGTIKLKAEFPNADGALFANQFVNVRMPVETRLKATLAPTAAIQRGAAGTFVYVVKDDQTVVVTPVKTGPTQGEITVIDGGVSAGAMVVIDGADRLREGTKVEIIARDPRANGGA